MDTPQTARADVVAEVRVQGDRERDPVAGKDTGVAGSVVSRDRLAGPGLEAQDVLRTQPGVVVTESGGFGAPATAQMRGATAADTPVYLGGARLNDDVAGTADLSLVPLWLIDRIEVYRGDAPLEADRLGPGGALFFEPRRPHGTDGGFGQYGGSWGAGKAWVYQDLAQGPVAALVGVSADHATNRYPFHDDHGTLFEPQNATNATRQNADESTIEGWGLGRVELGGGAVADVLVNEIVRQQGVPSLALVPTREARETASRTLASVGIQVPLAGGAATIDERTSLLIGRTAYSDPLLELAIGSRSLDLLGRRVDESAGAIVDLGSALRLHPQVEFSHEAIERTPGDVPLDRAHREFGRLAMSAEEKPAAWLTLRALASGECHHTGAKGGEACDVIEPTGRVGAEAGTRRLRILAGAGRYVRVPTLGEVYGISGVIHGNASLVPETGETVDLGLRAQAPAGPVVSGAFLDAFGFVRWAGDLVVYRRSGQGFISPYNVGAARVLGVEALAGVELLRVLRAEIALTALDPRDTSDGRATVNDVLPFRSRLIAAPRLRADWKRGGRRRVLSALGGEVSALYQSSRYVDPAGLGVIPEQLTVDAEVDARWFDGLLTVRARVADVFDAVRTDIVGYPLPGRSFYFGTEVTW